MATPYATPGSMDCHVHSFDPDRIAYKVAQETDPDDMAAMARHDDDSQRAVLNGFGYIM
jgi:hypothetical protein